jgi:hypothetical protein
VDAFAKEGYLEEKTGFGFTEFLYAMQSLPALDNLSATYIGNKMTVFVPGKKGDEWTCTDLVGFSDEMEIGSGKKLLILIEKDFACIDHTDEDQSDNYPNPNKAC